MFLKFGIIFLSLGLVSCDQMSTLTIVTKWVRDMTECGFESYPTDCLEARTIRQLHGMNSELQRDLNLTKSELNRSAKNLKDDTDEELQSLEVENQDARIALEKKIVESRGLVDEIGDFIVYLTGKILSPFIGGRGDDTSEEEIDYHQKQAVEERGHKKKYLKKENKKLKLILLLMLFKNKIKMFVSKLQFLVQLKFLGVATINMLANVFRLWIELKKKHKPSKVVFYENAHHQHHYDHEHLIDHEDGHFGHPASHGPFGHHEEEDYGGGPWPWSRSYEKPSAQSSQKPSGPYKYKPGYNYYYNERNLS